MAAQPILILNPRKRRMPAGLRRYWASRRSRRHRAHNPRRHRAHRRSYRRRARAYNPRRRHRAYRRHHYRRRNPGHALERDIFGAYLVPGVIGAIGAIGFDVVWGYVEPQLPASFQNGWIASVAELVALWFTIKAADSMAPRHRQTIHRAGLGAATVIAYNALEGLAAQYLPAGTPGLSGYMPASRFSLGRMVGPGMMGLKGYMPRTVSGLRGLDDVYYSPAAVIPNSGAAPQQFGQVSEDYE